MYKGIRSDEVGPDRGMKMMSIIFISARRRGVEGGLGGLRSGGPRGFCVRCIAPLSISLADLRRCPSVRVSGGSLRWRLPIYHAHSRRNLKRRRPGGGRPPYIHDRFIVQ